MTKLVKIETPKITMTSREIAELTGKRHDNVMRDIREMLEELELGLLSFEESYLNSQNKKQPMFALPKDLTLTLVLGYSIELRHKIVTRWLELEAAFANPPRIGLILNKRKSNLDMTEALKNTREDLGKDTKAHHYMHEAKLCNWVVSGKFEALDEASLSNADVELLRLVRIQNASMLNVGMEYDERKPKLLAFAMRKRTKLLTAYID